MRCALLLVVAACSSPSDPVITHDSAMVDADLAAHCLIKGNYGALGAITGTAGTAQSGDTTLTFVLANDASGKDDLFFRLAAGKGVFAGGVAAGTYTIAGADASYPSCGLCTNLIADITSSGPAKFYFAATGTVTLDTVTAPITGNAANLHFTEIDIATGMTSSDCVADIASVSFTAN
ncbi:MAG: hypothetical protein ABI678_04170 [Kofleriaceae bacterium]